MRHNSNILVHLCVVRVATSVHPSKLEKFKPVSGLLIASFPLCLETTLFSSNCV